MGIRLDQLHSEVFAKISNDFKNNEKVIYDYLDNRISEINVSFDLPEASYVERDVEVNKRNLEKSGFIELNRNFVPFRTGDQSDTGVWVSNLNTNESPFEPRTVDGQKRGISIGGHILNYTIGNVGQNIDKMMKLPIAPKLPVFFPEDNDMSMEFVPSKKVTRPQIVLDTTLKIIIDKRITDENKIQLSKSIDNGVTTYYYMDKDSNVFYLNNEGRSYRQNAPASLLVEPYTRFTKSFANTFTFDMIYDDNASKKYVDPVDSKLFEIKTPLGLNASQVKLQFNDKQVYLEDVTITRTIIDSEGNETEVSETKPRLVTYTVRTTTLNGLENQQLMRTLVSSTPFDKVIKPLVDGGENYTMISDNDFTMFVSPAKMHYCLPVRKYAVDAGGNNIVVTDDEIAADNTIMWIQPDPHGDKYKLEFDTNYRLYLPLGSDAPASGTIQVTDNITNGVVDRTVYSIDSEIVSYYRIDSLMFQETNDITVLDDLGNPVNVKVNGTDAPNINRPMTLGADGSISTTYMTGAKAGQKFSNGKAYYYHHKVGTKYYRLTNNSIYYLNNVGDVFKPAQDVQEIFSGRVVEIETEESTPKMLYVANGNLFYFDSDNLRMYVKDEAFRKVQLTDVNGYRVFKKADGTQIFVDTPTRMVTISEDGTETEVNALYSELTPVFETADVTTDELNLVIPIPFNFVQGNIILTRNGGKPLAKYSEYNAEAILKLQKDLEFNEETKKGDTLYVKRVGKKDIILRLEKKGTATNDIAGHWANDTGDIVMPEPLTGNYFNWTEGELLTPGKQLSSMDVVKGKNSRYYQYTGTPLKYEDMGVNKAITVDPISVFWEDVTVQELEYERKGQNFKIMNAANGDTIRFTIIRRVWDQHPVTGEFTVIERPAYSLEKVAANDGMNLFTLNDPNFILDDDASLKSYILVIENIKYYSTYKANRANNFLLMLTGLQTVAKNDDPAMIYGDEYYLSKYVLHLTTAQTTDKMRLQRIQAPQAELKIDFNTTAPSQTVTVPFEIIKNKFDIVVPKTLAGHEYTWIMGEKLPEGKTLVKGDVIFDKVNTKFYKYVGTTKTTLANGTRVSAPEYVSKVTATITETVQKELLRQYYKLPTNPAGATYWKETDVMLAKNADILSRNDGLVLTYFIQSGANLVLNTSDAKVVEYIGKARVNMIDDIQNQNLLTLGVANTLVVNTNMTAAAKAEIVRILGQKPTPRETLNRQTAIITDNVQKEIIRQFNKFPLNGDAEYWKETDALIIKNAEALSTADGLSLVYTKVVDGLTVINTSDAKVSEYMITARAKMIDSMEHIINDALVDSFEKTLIMTDAVKAEIKKVLATNLPQFVLKSIKLDAKGEPVLDEDGNYEYVYSYTRNFMVETRANVTTGKNEFITRAMDAAGTETVLLNYWFDITAPKVGYYRFGKTFTILHTKAKDQIVVRLLSSGAEAFTSKRITSQGGELTFAVDFNIEVAANGVEIPFEVIHEEINWTEEKDYIQENQKLTLNMVPTVGQNVIIRRNDEFDMIDIVVLERKDLVFIEMWHEDVSETGFIFPFGNVQFQGASADGVMTDVFDHVFYDTIAGETSKIENGAQHYCRVYQKGDIVYNYYGGTAFEEATPEEIKHIDKTFVEDTTIGRGWKVSSLTEEQRTTIFKNSDHNLYYDGGKLIQVRYRTRVVALNLFKNYFKGTSEYMSEGLRFQGKSPVTSRIVTREVGTYTTMDGDGKQAGQPILETIQIHVGGNLIIASDHNSLLYKEGKLYDDSLFTVEEKTPLSHNGYVHAVPVAIINRRNQGVYHPEFNDNGTGFFINGIYVSEDKQDFQDDITGFTLVDENRATLETSSVGRDRKAKFKVMLKWLFSGDYKAGGSMVSRTTYRPDGLLYDEINTRDIIDLRIDANDHRRRLEDLEHNVDKSFKMIADLTEETRIKFDQTNNYISTTANLLYKHIAITEAAIRKDMNAKDTELTTNLETTNVHLADLSANVFTKSITTNLLIDTMVGLVTDMDADAFDAWKTSGAGKNLKDASGNALLKPNKAYIDGMIKSFVENMEGPYTQVEFMKFLVTVLKSVTDKTMLSAESLEMWIKRLSVKNLALDPESAKNTAKYTRAETLELIYEGLMLASFARVLPPSGSNNTVNWAWKGTRFDGFLGTKNLELVSDFLENGRTPVATKDVLVTSLTKTYSDVLGKSWNSGFIAGPTVWGNVHNYHAIYTAWIFVKEPFAIENVMMNGDDPHAVYINRELIARNKFCCRDTAYSYEFAVPGWYRIDAMYSEAQGGHYVQLGWNPLDYKEKIQYMTTTDMDFAVEVTKMRLDNWASKLKSLVSTIKGDASGNFTKLEVKLIMIEGLRRIRNDILSKGTTISADDYKLFHASLDTWLNTGKFKEDLGYDVQEETINGVAVKRPNEFRKAPNDAGKYNKEEVFEIVKTGLKLVNGIDSISSVDIGKWVDRLDISITMPATTYFDNAQVDALIKDGLNLLAGLDTATEFEIEKRMKDLITVNAGGKYTPKATDVGTSDKLTFKTSFKTTLQAALGAQSLKTKV